MTLPEFLDHLGTGTRHLLDAVSATVALGVIVQALPPLAAVMTVLWTGLQMYGYIRRKGWMTQRELDEEANKRANP